MAPAATATEVTTTAEAAAKATTAAEPVSAEPPPVIVKRAWRHTGVMPVTARAYPAVPAWVAAEIAAAVV
jgi:hypothetical protein